MHEEPQILVERKGATAVVSLNRPDKLNALTQDMFRQLSDHLDASLAGASCVHLRANGRSFCAGHDLDDLAETETYEAERLANDVIERLANLPMPVVASVRGHCFTGGLEMILAADIIVAAESAVFADTHSKWDLVPIWGLTQRLPRRVGRHRAMDLMFSGRRCGGAEAKAIGLAEYCVADDALESFTEDLCRAIEGNSLRSNSAIKTLLRATDGMPLAQGLAWELHRSEGHGPEFQERLAQMRR